MAWKIPLSDLDYGQEEEEAVLRVLRNRWLTAGPEVEAFESELNAWLGSGHAVMTSSATTALHLGLRLLGIGPGCEVLVPSLTFIATSNVALYERATPVFCDIHSSEDPTIDPEDAARRMSPRCRAIIPMHYAGHACDMAALREAIDGRANQLGIPPPFVLEDAAHAIGSRLGPSHRLGTTGEAGAFSFFSNKNLAVGEGGALWTPTPEQAARARTLRSHGLSRATWERHAAQSGEYDAPELGWNYRPTEITAALARVQLAKIDSMNERRRARVGLYREMLSGMAEISLPFLNDTRTLEPACHIFAALFPDASTASRVRQALNDRGIQTSHHYQPIHTLSFYRRRLAGAPPKLPRTEEFARRQVTLPLWSGMAEEQVVEVVAAVKEALARR